jgi:hypothetical protein
LERSLSFYWNRSRATALAITLLLHGMAAIWLLSVRMQASPLEPVPPDLIWMPTPETAQPEPPRPPGPASVAAASPPTPIVVPAPEEETESNAITLPDWEGEARAIAREFGREPERRRFGPEPEQEPQQLKSKRPPPSVFERPLPHVGTTVRTPEGEQILWVSDNCYVSLESQSLTMREHHALKRGITTCQIGVGKRKARVDLFDPIKRPPKPLPLPKAPSGTQQEPGCGPGADPTSCAP